MQNNTQLTCWYLHNTGGGIFRLEGKGMKGVRETGHEETADCSQQCQVVPSFLLPWHYSLLFPRFSTVSLCFYPLSPSYPPLWVPPSSLKHLNLHPSLFLFVRPHRHPEVVTSLSPESSFGLKKLLCDLDTHSHSTVKTGGGVAAIFGCVTRQSGGVCLVGCWLCSAWVS